MPEQKRVPVLLDEDKYETLRKLSFESRLSMSEHIRRAIEKYLKSLSR
jgi:hypothetical protein